MDIGESRKEAQNESIEENLYSITEINQGVNNMDYIMLIGTGTILIFAISVWYGIGGKK